jgi:hypothetical protein
MSRHVCFTQDMIRRAGDAMRESGSCDWYRLARIALEHGVPDTETASELLDSVTTRKPAAASAGELT